MNKVYLRALQHSHFRSYATYWNVSTPIFLIIDSFICTWSTCLSTYTFPVVCSKVLFGLNRVCSALNVLAKILRHINQKASLSAAVFQELFVRYELLTRIVGISQLRRYITYFSVVMLMSILGLHTEIAQYSCKLCTPETGCYSSMLADKQPCFSVNSGSLLQQRFGAV